MSNIFEVRKMDAGTRLIPNLLFNREPYKFILTHLCAGMNKLFETLQISPVQEKDIFTLAAERIDKLTVALEQVIHHGTDVPESGKSEAEWWEAVARNCMRMAAKGLRV